MDWTREGRMKARAYHRVMTQEVDGFSESAAPLSWSSLRHLLVKVGILKRKG